MAEVNWTRGFSRLYLLAVVGWFAYWFVWIPLEEVQSWGRLALATGDPADSARANLVAQWGMLFQEAVRTPVATIVVVFLPPVFGYGILLGILATVRWILRGFLASNPPSKALQRTPGSEER
jgi:hypothetical protein